MNVIKVLNRVFSEDVYLYFTRKLTREMTAYEMIFGKPDDKMVGRRAHEIVQSALENDALELILGYDEKSGEKLEVLVFKKMPADYEDFVY